MFDRSPRAPTAPAPIAAAVKAPAPAPATSAAARAPPALLSVACGAASVLVMERGPTWAKPAAWAAAVIAVARGGAAPAAVAALGAAAAAGVSGLQPGSGAIAGRGPEALRALRWVVMSCLTGLLSRIAARALRRHRGGAPATDGGAPPRRRPPPPPPGAPGGRIVAEELVALGAGRIVSRKAIVRDDVAVHAGGLVAELAEGTRVHVAELATSSSGRHRARITAPVRGWLSLRAADGTLIVARDDGAPPPPPPRPVSAVAGSLAGSLPD